MLKKYVFLIMLTALSLHFTSGKIVYSACTITDDSLKIVEKVYLHCDRNYYYSGDDIWFKAYLIDASDRSLSNHSNNLHVDLISPYSKVISSRVIRLEEGLGNGDFQLPDDLQPGRYFLRAYTNYMRNFKNQLFFTKEIIVINSSGSSDNLTNIKYTENKIDIKFFPEGGSLVDNVTSVVAFKAVDGHGKGINVSGEIYSSTGDLITSFRSSHLGMGTFFLKPIPGLTYSAVVRNNNGLVIKSELPKSFAKGVTLNITLNQNKELQITVRTNPQTLPRVLDNNLLLTFSARKKPLKTISFKIKSLTNSFVLPTDDLPDGIVMATLSDPDSLPHAERLIYLQKHGNVKVNIEVRDSIYKQRDPVSIKISLSSDSGQSRQAFLSFSAAENSLSDSTFKYSSTISSWFLLESDVRGTVEEPSYYFDSANPDRLKHLDLLLMTQGWRDFEWKYNGSGYLAENGFAISGKLRRTLINKPLEKSKVNIGIFQPDNILFTIVPTDSSGKYILSGIDLTGEARLVVTSVGKKDHIQGILLLDSITYLPPEASGNTTPQIELLEENLSLLTKYDENRKVIKKKYKLTDTISLAEVTVTAKKKMDPQAIKVENSRAVYGYPDKEILITPREENFSNAIEVLRGRVAGVLIKGNPPDYDISIRGVSSINSITNPLILIDGFRRTIADLVSMPVYFIDRIDILKTGGVTAMYGAVGANGVISVITKTGDRFIAKQPVDYAANIKITGYDAPRIYYSTVHFPDNESKYNPDLRSTLFWQPNIILESNKDQIIKYFNADNSSTIHLVIEGITKDGIPVAGKAEYEVR